MSPPVAACPVETSLIMVSTYTDNAVLAHIPKGDKGDGVVSFHLDVKSGQLMRLNTAAVGPNIAFLLKHPQLNIVYATTECINQNGEVLTMALGPDGALTVLQRTDAGGRSTCYLNLDRELRLLTVVNYWDAKVCTFSVNEDGTLGMACDMDMLPGAEYVMEKNPDRMEHWQYRQRWPHAHCAKSEPYNKDRMFVCDLGRDKVLHYVLDRETGKLRLTGDVQLERGIGPRHIEFHPRLRVAYVTCELNSTVLVCQFNKDRESQITADSLPLMDDVEDKGALLRQVQVLSTLPGDWHNQFSLNEQGIWKAASHSSEIRLHPNGRFLYIGNRGHDSIACFMIDQQTGLLTLAGVCPSGGKTPRNFDVDASGKWMVVGNQDSNILTVHAIDDSNGTLTPTSQVKCASVNYVYPVPQGMRTSAA